MPPTHFAPPILSTTEATWREGEREGKRRGTASGERADHSIERLSRVSKKVMHRFRNWPPCLLPKHIEPRVDPVDDACVPITPEISENHDGRAGPSVGVRWRRLTHARDVQDTFNVVGRVVGTTAFACVVVDPTYTLRYIAQSILVVHPFVVRGRHQPAQLSAVCGERPGCLPLLLGRFGTHARRRTYVVAGSCT